MGLYRAVGRPLFFALPPEAAHRAAGTLLRLPLPWRSIGGAVDDPVLRTELAGIPLRNPVGLAAGFDKSCRFLGALGDLGFGYVVGGSLTLAPRTGNRKPRIVRRPQDRAIVNAMGLPNRGAAEAANRLQHRRRTSPVIVSVAAEPVEDVVRAHALVEAHADGVELNGAAPAWPGPRRWSGASTSPACSTRCNHDGPSRCSSSCPLRGTTRRMCWPWHAPPWMGGQPA